jgi:serine phosphatase RsbU (regulator of sigma subunit)
MSAQLVAHEGPALLALYSAEDEAEFGSALNGILAERFGVAEFAVHLLDRRRRRFLELESAPGAAARLAAGVQLPLRVQGAALGVLSLPSAVAASAELADFSSHVALALYFRKFIDQQGRLMEESLAHVQALKAMGDLLGELEPELVLSKTLKFFVDLVGAEVGAARLLAGERCLHEARWGLPVEVLGELVTTVAAGGGDGSAWLQRIPLSRQRFAGFSVGSVLYLPFELRPPYTAQVFLLSGEEIEIGQHQGELVGSCHAIGGIALQKSLDHLEQIRQHRLNEQLLVAKDIQAKLLPSVLPQLPTLDIAGLSLPAQAVGGDYFDVLALPGGDLLAIVADVSGKGIQAAIRMSGLQALMHSLGFQNLQPGQVLAQLNEVLGSGGLSGHFVTAYVLRIAADGRRVRFASAGHEALLLAQGDGRCQSVDRPGGLPLGLRTAQQYPESELLLAPGDRLLVYTDGITDTRNGAGELYGLDRLQGRLGAAPERSAQAWLAGLVADLERFRGETPWSDDLTALTFHHRAGGKY